MLLIQYSFVTLLRFDGGKELTITLCNTQKSTRDLWPFLYAKLHGKSISGLPFVELGIVFTELSLYTLLVIIIK